MKISDSLHLEKENLITKFHLSRINKEGNVVKGAHVKIDKIFSKFEFLQNVKLHTLTTSDQNLMNYDSLDSL